MKRNRWVIVLTILSFLITVPVLADSPVTSTGFSEAYLDIGLVRHAAKIATVDLDIARFLASPSKPIDVKAAIINAMSFGSKNGSKVEEYARIIYNKPVNRIDTARLSGYELFCIGYLTAMEDYFHPDRALPYLEKAKAKLNDSFTVAIILAIVKGQQRIDHQDKWPEIWNLAEEVLNEKSLQQDMRPEAKQIIIDYLILYK